jgi:hypothetical protein
MQFIWLEPKDLVDEDDGDAAGYDLAVHDQDLVDSAVYAVRELGAGVLERKGVRSPSTARSAGPRPRRGRVAADRSLPQR